MRFCQTHWDQLRQAIDARGLSAFVAKDGQTATAQMVKQIQTGEDSKATFDPLMSAHWAIATNAMQTMERAGMDPLYLIAGGPEDPVDVTRAGERYAGRTWPKCPLCYLNLAHELTCTHEACRLDRERGYDWMIDRAAADALDRAREYGFIA